MTTAALSSYRIIIPFSRLSSLQVRTITALPPSDLQILRVVTPAVLPYYFSLGRELKFLDMGSFPGKLDI